ncbi:MAG: DUF4214 domain-containing protein, partial [Ruthenibacterium sp.]
GIIGDDYVGATGDVFVASADADVYTKADIRDITMQGAEKAYYEIEPAAANVPCTLTINQASLKTGAQIEDIAPQQYTGQAITPTPVITLVSPTQILIPDADYTVKYLNNVNGGTAEVVVMATPTGNYSGAVRKQFVIQSSESVVEVHADQAVYTYGDYMGLQATVKLKNRLSVATTVDFYIGEGAETSYLGSAELTDGVAVGIFRTDDQTIPVGDNQLITAEITGDPSFGDASGTTTISMKAKELVVTGVGTQSKKYDRSADFAAGEPVFVKGIIGKDIVSVTGQATVDEADAGIYRIADVSDIEIMGEDAYFYTMPTTAVNVPGVLTIETQKVTVEKGDFAISKEYDGTDDFTEEDSTGSLKPVGILPGDTVTADVVEYSTEQEPCVNAGTHKIALRYALVGANKGNYTLTDDTYDSFEVSITAKQITDKMIADIPQQRYVEGTPATPTPVVTDGTPSIITAKDYKVTYTNNDAPGIGIVHITAAKRGNYSGEATKNFVIKAESDLDVFTGKPEYVYGEDVELTAKIPMKKGEAVVVKPVVEFFSGDAKGTSLGKANVDATGTAKLTVKTLEQNIPTGESTITAVYSGEGKPNLGTGNAIVVLNKKEIKTILGAVARDRDYDGTKKVEIVSLKLDPKEVIDPTVTVSGEGVIPSGDVGKYSNIKADVSALTLDKKGAKWYSIAPTAKAVVIQGPLLISPKLLTAASGTLVVTKEYDGTTKFTDKNATGTLALVGLADKEDKVTAKILEYGQAPNKNAGTQKIAVRFTLEGDGIANYMLKDDLCPLEATITPKTLTGTAGDLKVEKVYDGTPKFTDKNLTGTIALTGFVDKADKVTAEVTEYGEAMNKNAGTQKMAVRFGLVGADRGNYMLKDDLIKLEATVTQKPLADSMMEAIPNQKYTGESITPIPKVTDGTPNAIAESDYELSYTDNVKKGTGTVHITATKAGNYSGTASKTFVIEKSEQADSPKAFVEQMYQNVFGRAADAAGLEAWTKGLTNKTIDGATFAKNFIFSKEYENKNATDTEYLTMLYAAFFGREPDATGFAAWLKVLENGASRELLLKNFVEAQEYKNVCAKLNIAEGAIKTTQPRDENLNVTAFTNRLYQICLGRRGEESGLNAWTNVLNRKVQTPKDVAHGFVFSKEFLAKNYNNTDYVKQLYRALMGREADAGGLENWVKALDSGKMNRETVFGHFADSKEFGIIQKSFGL